MSTTASEAAPLPAGADLIPAGEQQGGRQQDIIPGEEGQYSSRCPFLEWKAIPNGSKTACCELEGKMGVEVGGIGCGEPSSQGCSQHSGRQPLWSGYLQVRELLPQRLSLSWLEVVVFHFICSLAVT